MTVISNVQTVPRVAVAVPGETVSGEPPILPKASMPSTGALSDALSQLYAAMSQQRDTQANLAKGQNEVADAERKTAQQKQEHAMKRAQEAAEKGGFFDWVSNDIGLVGAVGLVTFSYTAVAADLLAHKLGAFDHIDEKIDLVDVAAVATGRWDIVAAEALLRKTDLAPEEARKLLDQCGLRNDVPGISEADVKPVAEDLLKANLMILAIGATVLSCGSTSALIVALAGFAVSQAGTYVAKEGTFGEFSEYIGLGMQLGGAALMGGAAFASGGALVNGAKTGAGLANAAHSTAQGTDKIVTTVHEYQKDEANKDVEAARHRLTQVQRMAEMILDQAKEANDSHRKAAEAVNGVIEKVNATHVALAKGVRA